MTTKKDIAARKLGPDWQVHYKVMDDVDAERHRQIEKEGWTFEHDDQYNKDQLVSAAICYARPRYPYPLDGDTTPIGWPWDNQWWKPKDRRRNLVRAVALLIAEIERSDREKARSTPVPDS